MVSPHLLKVIESFSTSDQGYNKKVAELAARQMWEEHNVPIYFIEPTKKKSSWCHMVLASGPALGEGTSNSELIVIWWSEFTPDTSRVLSIVDWEKHAQNV